LLPPTTVRLLLITGGLSPHPAEHLFSPRHQQARQYGQGSRFKFSSLHEFSGCRVSPRTFPRSRSRSVDPGGPLKGHAKERSILVSSHHFPDAPRPLTPMVRHLFSERVPGPPLCVPLLELPCDLTCVGHLSLGFRVLGRTCRSGAPFPEALGPHQNITTVCFPHDFAAFLSIFVFLDARNFPFRTASQFFFSGGVI